MPLLSEILLPINEVGVKIHENSFQNQFYSIQYRLQFRKCESEDRRSSCRPSFMVSSLRSHWPLPLPDHRFKIRTQFSFSLCEADLIPTIQYGRRNYNLNLLSFPFRCTVRNLQELTPAPSHSVCLIEVFATPVTLGFLFIEKMGKNPRIHRCACTEYICHATLHPARHTPTVSTLGSVESLPLFLFLQISDFQPKKGGSQAEDNRTQKEQRATLFLA